MKTPRLTRNQWIAIVGLLVPVLAAVITIFWQRPTTEYAPQTIQNSPGGIQVQGNLNVENNEFPKPTIEYSTTSAISLGRDGLYHQTFELRFYYVMGTNPVRSFRASKYLTSCNEPQKSSGPSFDNGRYFESSTIECWMRIIPPSNEILFWY